MNEMASIPVKKKDNHKSFLIAGLALALVVAVATSLFVFIFSGEDEKIEQDNAQIEVAASPPAYMEIPPLLINLNAATGTRYLRLRLQLELASQADLPIAEAAMPRIVDRLQTYLRQLSADDLSGAAGTQRLQAELPGLVATVDHQLAVKDILIQEMLIQ